MENSKDESEFLDVRNVFQMAFSCSELIQKTKSLYNDSFSIEIEKNVTKIYHHRNFIISLLSKNVCLLKKNSC